MRLNGGWPPPGPTHRAFIIANRLLIIGPAMVNTSDAVKPRRRRPINIAAIMTGRMQISGDAAAPLCVCVARCITDMFV